MIRRLFEHIERLNTSQRAGLVSSSLVLLAGLIISLLTYNHLRTVNSELTEQNIQRDLNHLGTLLTPSLLRNDRLSLKLLLDEWDLDAGITAVRLTNNDGATLASRGEINDNSSVIQSDIIQDNKRFGTLLVSTSSEPAVTMANRFASLSIMLTAALTLIAGLAGWLLAESHRRYLKRLTIKLEEWKAGENLQMPTVPSNPDLFSMHTSLSDIARKEQQRLAVENALSQFMGTSSEPHNTDPMRYYECAILFIEIQDLNELQHRLSAEALTSTLNQYHRLLSQAAKLYNGKVDRFLGDGVVMLFGIPHKDTNASMHCLYAARLFTGLVEHMRNHQTDLLPLEFNIAAHFGPVLMAPMQDELSTQYSIIGDTVHWASNLASHSEERRIVVSQVMVENMEHGHDVIWREGPTVKDLHGGEQRTYWLDSLPENNERLVQRQIQHITSMTESA